jgi:CRISPR/Cas system-associated endonuclease Cas1
MVDEHKHVQRRQAQYVRLSDKAFVLRTTQAIVQGKLRNAARFLAQRGSRYNFPELNLTAARIKGLAAAVGTQSQMELLRGMEGNAANTDFEVFPQLIRVQGIRFDGRNRRPLEMKPKIAKAFIEAYEEWMANRIIYPETGAKVDYRGLIKRQVWKFCRYLLGEEETYEAFIWSEVL